MCLSASGNTDAGHPPGGQKVPLLLFPLPFSFNRSGNGSISGKKAGFRRRASVSVRARLLGSGGSLRQAVDDIDQLI